MNMNDMSMNSMNMNSGQFQNSMLRGRGNQIQQGPQGQPQQQQQFQSMHQNQQQQQVQQQNSDVIRQNTLEKDVQAALPEMGMYAARPARPTAVERYKSKHSQP